MQFCDLLQAAEWIGHRILTWSLSLTPACLVHVGMTMVDNFKCRTAKYRTRHADYHRTWCLKTLSRTLSLNNLRKKGRTQSLKSLTGMPPFSGYRDSPPISLPTPSTPAKGPAWFSRQEYWNALPFPSPVLLLNAQETEECREGSQQETQQQSC